MIKEAKVCAREECDVEFIPSVHNQRFCCKDCCKIHTNKRILAQYHERKNKKMKDRVCAHKGCGTILSRYNPEKYCSLHEGRYHLQQMGGQ